MRGSRRAGRPLRPCPATCSEERQASKRTPMTHPPVAWTATSASLCSSPSRCRACEASSDRERQLGLADARELIGAGYRAAMLRDVLAAQEHEARVVRQVAHERLDDRPRVGFVAEALDLVQDHHDRRVADGLRQHRGGLSVRQAGAERIARRVGYARDGDREGGLEVDEQPARCDVGAVDREPGGGPIEFAQAADHRRRLAGSSRRGDDHDTPGLEHANHQRVDAGSGDDVLRGPGDGDLSLDDGPRSGGRGCCDGVSHDSGYPTSRTRAQAQRMNLVSMPVSPRITQRPGLWSLDFQANREEANDGSTEARRVRRAHAADRARPADGAGVRADGPRLPLLLRPAEPDHPAVDLDAGHRARGGDLGHRRVARAVGCHHRRGPRHRANRVLHDLRRTAAPAGASRPARALDDARFQGPLHALPGGGRGQAVRALRAAAGEAVRPARGRPEDHLDVPRDHRSRHLRGQEVGPRPRDRRPRRLRGASRRS